MLKKEKIGNSEVKHGHKLDDSLRFVLLPKIHKNNCENNKYNNFLSMVYTGIIIIIVIKFYISIN